jgi:hypothetical protein
MIRVFFFLVVCRKREAGAGAGGCVGSLAAPHGIIYYSKIICILLLI